MGSHRSQYGERFGADVGGRDKGLGGRLPDQDYLPLIGANLVNLYGFSFLAHIRSPLFAS